MRNRNGLNVDVANTKRLAVFDTSKLWLQVRVFAKLLAQESERECGSKNGYRQLREQVGQGPLVIFVRMSEHDAAQLFDALAHVGDVGNDVVHARLLIGWEEHATVDDHQIF